MLFCGRRQILVIVCLFFLMIRRPPRSTLDRSSAASDVYKRQGAYLGNFFAGHPEQDIGQRAGGALCQAGSDLVGQCPRSGRIDSGEDVEQAVLRSVDPVGAEDVVQSAGEFEGQSASDTAVDEPRQLGLVGPGPHLGGAGAELGLDIRATHLSVFVGRFRDVVQSLLEPIPRDLDRHRAAEIVQLSLIQI